MDIFDKDGNVVHSYEHCTLNYLGEGGMALFKRIPESERIDALFDFMQGYCDEYLYTFYATEREKIEKLASNPVIKLRFVFE